MTIGPKKVRVYDPELLSARVAGQYLTGYSDNGKFTCEQNEDNSYPYVGVDGTVSYAKGGDKSAIVTITLAGTSPSIPYVTELARNGELFNLTIVDMNENGENISCDDCVVIKAPDNKKGWQGV